MSTFSEYDVKFIGLLMDAGFKPRGYSGRGMYGAECVAIAAESGDSAGYAIARQFGKEVYDFDLDMIMNRTRTDSLGKGVILYWPSIEWTQNLSEIVEDEYSYIRNEAERNVEQYINQVLTKRETNSTNEYPTPEGFRNFLNSKLADMVKIVSKKFNKDEEESHEFVMDILDEGINILHHKNR